jgi:hypothetical protein
MMGMITTYSKRAPFYNAIQTVTILLKPLKNGRMMSLAALLKADPHGTRYGVSELGSIREMPCWWPSLRGLGIDICEQDWHHTDGWKPQVKYIWLQTQDS